MQVEDGELGGVGGDDQRDNVGAEESTAANDEDVAQWLLGFCRNWSHCCVWGLWLLWD